MRLLPDRDEIGYSPYLWTVYLVFFFMGPLMSRASAEVWVATIAGAVVFLALYFRGYWVPGPRLLIYIAGITALGLIFFPFNVGAGCFFIYAAAFAPYVGRTRDAVLTIAVINVLCIIEVVAFDIPFMGAFWPVVFTIVIGAANLHAMQSARSTERLRLAHDEIEHLAKVAERERIARDLHDLLGHTLSLIVLKSELASKLAESDVERARSEIRDVERISRDALAEVRAAVRGYRSGGIAAELINAREALAAAGVAVTADVSDAPLPPSHEAVLALTLREAVTNVIRHARASNCSIALRDGTLTVADNGRGTNGIFGSGLSGMRERVEALGGAMSIASDRGTMLTVTLPPVAGARTA